MPNQVLTEENYKIAIDTTKPREARIAAYNDREHWMRALTQNNAGVAEVMQRMIDQFGDMGVVQAREGAHDDPELPDVMYVENISPHVAEALRAAGVAAGLLPAPPEWVARAGWASAEQLEAFRSVRIRRQ